MAILLRYIARFLEPMHPQPEYSNEESIEEMPTLVGIFPALRNPGERGGATIPMRLLSNPALPRRTSSPVFLIIVVDLF